MRDGSFSRRGAGRYSKVPTSEEAATDRSLSDLHGGGRDSARLRKLREAGSLKGYLDELDNPDNEIFQRFLSTSIYVAMLWAGGFYWLWPETRPYIIVGALVCALLAYRLTWL